VSDYSDVDGGSNSDGYDYVSDDDPYGGHDADYFSMPALSPTKRTRFKGSSKGPSVAFAQNVFRNRVDKWKSFSVPEWYSSLFVHPSNLRRKVKDLSSYDKRLTLYVRMSWILFQESHHVTEATQRSNFALPIKFGKLTIRVRTALRAVSRKLLKSNLSSVVILPRPAPLEGFGSPSSDLSDVESEYDDY
jgi:hypothetical protein